MVAERHTFPREQRLRSKRRIDALFGGGQGGFVYPLRYVVLREQAPESEVCLLVSVPKRHHKRAHARNLLKRRLREAYRLQKEPLREAMQRRGERLSLALLYTSDRILAYAAIEQAVHKILETLLAEAQD